MSTWLLPRGFFSKNVLTVLSLFDSSLSKVYFGRREKSNHRAATSMQCVLECQLLDKIEGPRSCEAVEHSCDPIDFVGDAYRSRGKDIARNVALPSCGASSTSVLVSSAQKPFDPKNTVPITHELIKLMPSGHMPVEHRAESEDKRLVDSADLHPFFNFCFFVSLFSLFSFCFLILLFFFNRCHQISEGDAATGGR